MAIPHPLLLFYLSLNLKQRIKLGDGVERCRFGCNRELGELQLETAGFGLRTWITSIFTVIII